MTSTQEESNGPDPENCFKILLATDIHLGYKEKDEIIGRLLLRSMRLILDVIEFQWSFIMRRESLLEKNFIRKCIFFLFLQEKIVS